MQFIYKARSSDGFLKQGIIEANNETAAIDVIQKHNLTLISLVKKSEIPLAFINLNFLKLRIVKIKEVALFSRELAVLLSVGVSPVEALKVISGEIRNPFLREAVLDLMDDIEGGVSFSQALSKHPKIFSSFYINMIKTGEVSGRLQEVLLFLTDYLEKKDELNSKIKGALIYPAMIFLVFIIVGIVMLVFVIPQILSIVRELQADLPLSTRVLLFASDFTKRWWWFILLVLIGIAISIWRYIKTPIGKRIFDKIIIRLPIFGNLVKKIYLSRFSSNLSVLILSGLPIVEALQVTAATFNNVLFRETIFMAAEEVKKGNNIAEVLRASNIFPPLTYQMVAVGEKSGKLDMVLDNISNFYTREVTDLVANLTSLIEPFLIVTIGVAVGFLVSAVLLPIYNLVGTF